jgi:hypothetical protein
MSAAGPNTSSMEQAMARAGRRKDSTKIVVPGRLDPVTVLTPDAAFQRVYEVVCDPEEARRMINRSGTKIFGRDITVEIVGEERARPLTCDGATK